MNVVQNVNVVQNANVPHLRVVPDDRRERARDAKRRRILDAAGEVIDREGLAGLTMQAVADQIDCAVGTLYTAYDSKAALLVALQADAVGRMEDSYRAARAEWEGALGEEDLDDDLVAVVQLLAYGGFLAAASVVFRDEVALVRHLLGEVDPRTPALERSSGQELTPVVHRLLDPALARLGEAVAAGAISSGDGSARAITWVAGLLGVLRLERLAPVDRHLFRAAVLGRRLTEDLVVGWGAERDAVDVAAGVVERLAARGPLAPPPG
jgi:AcrR family transcriptional regulator